MSRRGLVQPRPNQGGRAAPQADIPDLEAAWSSAADSRRPSRHERTGHRATFPTLTALALATLLGCIPGGTASDLDGGLTGEGTGGASGSGGGTGVGGNTAGSSGLEPWQQAMLDATNHVRATAQPTPVPALAPLTWNSAAQAVAQAWANGCQWKHNAGRGNYGENIYASTGTTPAAPAAVVQDWASEAADYTWASDTCTAVCGHYTQLVWRGTTSVGCASAACTTGSPFAGFSNWTFWVCDYAPPGNFLGQQPY